MGHGQVRNFSPNEIIALEGETGDCAYLIERGRVLIYLNKNDTEVPLKILGQGEVFGEMSLIDNSPRSASCRALSDTQLIVVTKEQLIDRITTADPVVRLLMRALLERLRWQNDSIRGKKSAPITTNDVLEMEKKEAFDRIDLENRIATALKNDEFVPFYQPIYDLATSEVRGCEALIRWISDDGLIVSPSLFMDVIEQSALVIRAGQIMIEKCMEDLRILESRFQGAKKFFVSVNISGRQFADPHFLEHLEATRARFGLPSEQIKLEVTERVMMEGPEAILTLQKCKDLGYQLAIDDFGTGFSSLQYLASMPLNDLKIDRSFVMKMLKEEKSLSIVKSLVHMAGLLKLNLIAEGIETEQELALLKSLGVGMGQGFLFAKPVPLADFIRLPHRATSRLRVA